MVQLVNASRGADPYKRLWELARGVVWSRSAAPLHCGFGVKTSASNGSSIKRDGEGPPEK